MMRRRIFSAVALAAICTTTVGINAASADVAPPCSISISNVRLADADPNIHAKTTTSLVFTWDGTATNCTNPTAVSAELRQQDDPTAVEGLTNSGLDLTGATEFDGLAPGHSYVLTVTATNGVDVASAASAPATTLRGVADSVVFTTPTNAGLRPGIVQIAGRATDSGYPIASRPVAVWVAAVAGGALKRAATGATDEAGAFNFYIPLKSNSRITVIVDGVSTPARVYNVAYVMSVRSPATKLKAKALSRVTINVRPARRVSVNLYRLAGRSWVFVGKTRSTARGIASFFLRAKKTTTYRASVPSDVYNSSSTSPTFTLRVR
jgi:hypothetical protein